jgi:diguanylate cyclase (GGDEF)-like protein
MSTTQTLERVAAEVAIDLDALAGRISRELAVRVPEYERALVAAGDDPVTVCRGTLALLMGGLRRRELPPAAGAQVRLVGAGRCEAGVALDTLVEVISMERQLLGLAFEEAAQELGINGRSILLAERRLDRFAAGLIAEIARGYMAAVTERNRRQQESMAALVRVAAAINRSFELPDVAHTALKAITEALHADAGVLWLRAEEGGDLGLAYTHGLRWDEDRRLRTSASSSAPIVERAVRAGAAVSGPPLATNGEALLSGVAAIGVRSRGELMGVVLAGNRKAEPFSHAQLGFLRSASDYLAAALVRAQRHRREARTDSLTGLANRTELERQLEREIAGARRHGRPLGLLVVDLDGLKAINDEQGHPAGDAALRSLAGALLRSVRSTDTCARIGGDEFAIVMPDTTLAQATEVRARVARALAESGLRVSAGVAGWDPSLSAQELFKMADTRLYRAKRRHHRERGLGA